MTGQQEFAEPQSTRQQFSEKPSAIVNRLVAEVVTSIRAHGSYERHQRKVVNNTVWVLLRNGHLRVGDCICGTPGVDYEGPQVDCDVHGSPSEAYDAGYREAVAHAKSDAAR